MNKKRNYLGILSNFNEYQNKIYSVYLMNREYFEEKLFYSIKNDVAGCSELFLCTKELFKEWLEEDIQGETIPRIDTYMIHFLNSDNEFCEKFNSLHYEPLFLGIIRAWNNKTSSLKVNLSQIEMIYLKYISYLNGSSGKMKLSISPLFEDIAYNDENNIFQNLEECKKLVLKISKNPIEFFIISKLWDMTFYSRKFSYKDISEETKNTFGDKITKTKAFNIIKHIHIKIYEYLIESGLFEKYFDTERIFEMDNKIYTIESLIEKWIKSIPADYIFYEKKTRRLSIPNVELVSFIKNFCISKGLKYTTRTSNSDVLIALKADSNFERKKNYKLYFYKGGLYKDFRTGRYGNVKDLFPAEFK